MNGLDRWTLETPEQMLRYPNAELAPRLLAAAPGGRADGAKPSGNFFRNGAEPN